MSRSALAAVLPVQLTIGKPVSQSLAGRVGVLYPLPPGLDELARFDAPPRNLPEVVWTGSNPRIHDRRIPPDVWLRDYFATYDQRQSRGGVEVVPWDRLLELPW